MTYMADPVARVLGDWSAGTGIAASLFRLACALLLGAMIGWERSSKRHSAGFRTFILVITAGTWVILLDSLICELTGNSFFLLSAAFLVGLASISIHSIYYSSRNEIKGLTTAVALWATGAVGLMLGGGFYTLALAAFCILMMTLAWFPSLETYLKDRSNHFELHLELTSSRHLQDFVTTIRKLGLSISDIELNPAYAGSGLSVYSINVSIKSPELKKYKTHAEIIEALRTLDYISHIEEMH